MDIFTIAFTSANFCLTCVSIYCALRSKKETEKQTELMHRQTEIAQKQLEESYKPDYPTTRRLESIAISIQKLDGTLKNALKDK